MTAQLNHTIVWCRDNQRSSAFLADILGRPAPKPFHHFMIVELDNGVSIDFMAKEGPVAMQHYAFLVDDATFDHGFARIGALGLPFWADPARTQAGQINHHDGGRGVYFEDPDGHVLELLTTPYGVPKA
jgi:catechol 2,3-dioxygenase-like lactoylglutathione lyase family enzyme